MKPVLIKSHLALQNHDCVVEVMVLQRGGCSVEKSQSGTGPAGRKGTELHSLASLQRHQFCGRTPGLGDALGLESVVGAAVVQVMAEAADHQGQDLRVRQHVLEAGRLTQAKSECAFIICRNFLFLGTDQTIAGRGEVGQDMHSSWADL